MAAKKSAKPIKKPAKKAPKAAPFKLTYATMVNPPDEMHSKYEMALAKLKAALEKARG